MIIIGSLETYIYVYMVADCNIMCCNTNKIFHTNTNLKNIYIRHFKYSYWLDWFEDLCFYKTFNFQT